MSSPSVRVVVKLPYNRPENAPSDPPPVVWNEQKADTLWKVMARSRASDSGGTDWKSLAAHLEVPLPYLLYRAQTRFEEDLRGLQDIRGALSPVSPHSSRPTEEYFSGAERPPAAARVSSRLTTNPSRTSRLSTPLGVRARLASLGNNSPRLKTTGSASTLTPQGDRLQYRLPRSSSAVESSDESDSDEDDLIKEEEAERNQEEEEALDKKLKDLQLMITNDAVGLVSSVTSGRTRPTMERGRLGMNAGHNSDDRYRLDGSTTSGSASQSLSSSTSSAQGSYPSIPSPPLEMSRSAMNRHLSPSKSSSPPALSPRSARGQSHLRYGQMVSHSASESGSGQGSEASSFSDLSDASLSASALELLNTRNPAGSRFSSAFGRSRFGKGGGVHH